MSDKLVYEHLKQFTSTEGYWSTTDCITVAKDVLEITNAKTMLEIGFNIGYSAAIWLELGIEDLIALDIGYHSDTLPAIKATAKQYNTKKVLWWIGDSTSDEAKELDMPKIDMSFIDGEHSYRAAMSDSLLSIDYGADWLVYDDVIEFHSNGIDKVILELIQTNTIEIVKRYPMTWIGAGDVVLCKVVK
jgi:predicted O-methyltransferase YrrM